MGKNIDKTYIQMKMLNTGKGPAVRALRAQADKALYAMTMKHTVERQENLTLRQSMVDEILVEDGKVVGVRTATNQKYGAKAVVVTTGTALRGEIILGELKYSSGPNNSLASVTLADNLRDLGLEIGRFKTGTLLVSRHHQLIMKKLKFNQVTKSRIIFHFCRMMKIIFRIKFLVG